MIETSWLEYPDNESLSVNLYMTGCSNNCKGCQNTDLLTWVETQTSVIDELVNSCKINRTNKIVIAGGDPLFHKNLNVTQKILDVLHKEYNICVYTGHSMDYAKSHNIVGFTFLKCGVFDETKYTKPIKTDEYMQFATTNQELYDSSYNLLSKNGRYYF